MIYTLRVNSSGYSFLVVLHVYSGARLELALLISIAIGCYMYIHVHAHVRLPRIYTTDNTLSVQPHSFMCHGDPYTLVHVNTL